MDELSELGDDVATTGVVPVGSLSRPSPTAQIATANSPDQRYAQLCAEWVHKRDHLEMTRPQRGGQVQPCGCLSR